MEDLLVSVEYAKEYENDNVEEAEARMENVDELISKIADYEEKAEEQYRRLEELFFQQTPGRLILPSHAAVTAHFSRLGWLGQGDGQVVRYSFEFLEHPGSRWTAG